MAQPTKTRARQAVIAAFVSVLIIGTAVGLAIAAGDGPGDSPTTVAGTAPETVDYVNYETPEELLAGHAGRPLVINFFASWCAPCRAELPDLAAAHAKWGDQVDFVGVDFQEASEANAAELLYETGITYPIMEDPDGALLRELGTLPTMPTTIFVTADSAILERHHGLILSDQLDERIEEIIAAFMIFAFAAGLLSTVNPCGFAMLPAYLSFFMGLHEDEDVPRRVVVGRALKIGLIMSSGFVAIFGTTGLIIRFGGEAIQDSIANGLAWIAVVTGGGVVALGVWLLLGNSLKVRVPNFRTNTKSEGAGSIFTFGISYALASLSCAFPIFAGVVAASFSQNLVEGVGTFFAYAAGMAAVVMLLTVGLALGKDRVVHRLRRASHIFDRVSGVVLVVAGAFIVFYWTLVLSSGENALSNNGLTVWVESVQSRLTDLIGTVPLWLWIPALVTPIAVAVAYALRDNAVTERPLEESSA